MQCIGVCSNGGGGGAVAGTVSVEEGVWEGVGEGGGIECGFVGNSCCQLSVAWHPALC